METKKDIEREGGRNRCVFGGESNKELGGAAITPLKAAAHALQRSSRQSTQPSQLLPSQSPRCILIDCNCQLTACSGSGYCTLTFIISLFSSSCLALQRLSWDQQFLLFIIKQNPDCSVTLLDLTAFRTRSDVHPANAIAKKKIMLNWRLVEKMNIPLFLINHSLNLKPQLVKEMNFLLPYFVVYYTAKCMSGVLHCPINYLEHPSNYIMHETWRLTCITPFVLQTRMLPQIACYFYDKQYI